MDRPSNISSAEIEITEETSIDTETNNNEVAVSGGMDLDLFRAAEGGDIDALRKHKEHLHQILTVTNNTVLHIYTACAPRTNVVLEEILEVCPALLLQQNESGDTALHIAARHGRDDLVEALIKNAKARPGDVEEGFSASWPKMLIRTTNKEKETALHEAARFNRLKVVEILTREDPEFLYSANAYGETPLYMAVERRYRDSAFKILDTCTSPAYQVPNGFTALHVAVSLSDYDGDSLEMVEKLLKMIKRPLTKARDEEGRTPLHMAALNSAQPSIVKKLIETDRSAAYARTNEKEMTPLHCAALHGNLECIKELISQCPDCCELVDHKDQNILHYAAKNGSRDIVKFVQKNEWLSTVLLNAKDADGNTLLHQIAAADQFHNELELDYDFIKDDRIDKMAFNKENMTALDIIPLNDSLRERKVRPLTCLLWQSLA